MNFEYTSEVNQFTQGSLESAGYDIFPVHSFVIKPWTVMKISTSIRSRFTPGFVCLLKDRSGNAVKGLKVKAGVIDSDYRGEWLVVLYNESSDPISISKDKAIAQALFFELPKISFSKVSTIPFDSLRADSGFGSSDV